MRPLPSTQRIQDLQDLGQLDPGGLAAICRAWLGCHDDLLLLMTGDGRITHLARSGARPAPDLAERLDGAAWRPLWSKAGRRPAAAALAEAAAGRAARFQAAMPIAAGDETWFDVALAPVVNASGADAPRVLAVLRDITLFKREDERQAQSRRLEAIGRLAGGVAHDFNNLLTVIMSANEALAETAAEGENRHLAQVSLQAAGRGAELIRRLMAFVRPAPRPAHATADAAGAVEAAARLLQRTLPDNIRFEARAPEGLVYCRADRSELENALLNLCVNARDAMPGGGRLSLRAEAVALDRTEAQDLKVKPGDYVAFTVKDSGAGMSPETAARAIEPFFSTKTRSGGTGLGLSSVHGLAVSAGGALRIRSRLGQGAWVSLYIPRARAAAQPELDLKPDAARLPPAAVLLVEDDAAVRAQTARLLRAMGCCVTEAEDAEAALGALAGEAAIDLMVTDLDLPFGLDGAALAEAGLALRPDLKVLFTSGGLQAPLARPDLLAKPFGRAALFAAVQRQLERRPVPRQP